MGKLIHYVRDFVRNDWHPLPYAGVALLLVVALFINYSPLIDIQWVGREDGMPAWTLHFFLLYGGAYYAAALLGAKGSSRPYLTDARFWVFSLLLILTALLPKVGFAKPIDVLSMSQWSGPEKLFVHKSQFFLYQFVLTAVALGLMALLLGGWYRLEVGLRWDGATLRKYLLILLAVSPLMVAASFLPDFQKAYPQYKPWFGDGDAFGLSEMERTAIFTLCYSTGFLAVELLFRGAMVLGMFRIMGSRAVLPMAAMYCVFHFGKPMGEAIASIFGSYLLGVLALHGRSIMGGVVVHLGIALLMELLGHMQHHLR